MGKPIEMPRTLISQMGGSKNHFHTEQLRYNSMRVLFSFFCCPENY